MNYIHYTYLLIIFLLVMAVGTVHAADNQSKGESMTTNFSLETDPMKAAKMLAAADTWLLPQPKEVALTNEHFDLKKCNGIRLVGCDDT